MGDDLRVANAARVSFNKHHDVFTYRTDVEKGSDEGIINFLSSHNHFTPFTHCFVTLRETVPVFVARQRFKHTVGFSYNEESRRYVDEPPEFFYPEVWRKRAKNKKQGSSNDEIRKMKFIYGNGESTTLEIDEIYRNHCDDCLNIYDQLIDNDVAPEQARMVLPQSMYTSYYVSGSLAAWARAYKLRSAEDAQKEIQDLARQWNEIIKPLFPISWNALVNVE